MEWSRSILRKIVRWLFNVWVLCGIGGVLVTPVLYLQWPGFSEQGEVTFSAVSWLVVHGQPLYTDLAAADRYSLQHGPAIYLLVGVVMSLFGPGYLTAKLTSVVSFLLVFVISWLWFSRLADRQTAFCLVGLQSWILLHWPYTYLVRPDPIMLLAVVISMYIATTMRNRWMIVLGTAIPLGVMVNFKIHGVFYFLPILAIVYRSIGLRNIFLIGGLSLPVAIAPFLLPQISWTNYTLWLMQSIQHGLHWQRLYAKIALGFEFFMIPVAVGIIFGLDLGAFSRRHRWLVLSLIASSVIPVIVGSKVGSGQTI